MKQILSFLLALSFLLTACASPTPSMTPAAPTEQPPTPRTLTIMSHDSFAASQEVIAQFEQQNNVKIAFLEAGDTGSALNKAILSKDAPLADLFFGIDNTFLSRALEADIFEPYDSPLLAQIPAEFKLDPQNRALPVDYGDVCINYDKTWFAEKGLSVPTSLDDLLKPEYKGLLVVENPATSSPGLAFLLATIAKYGDPGYLEYWKALRENGVVVVDGWETAYYTNFSASSGKGPQPMVVSYASSPAAEVIFASQPLTEAPTASIFDGCFRQIEFVGILKGTPNRELAEKFVDFMLSLPFQEDVPLQMFVYPVLPTAKLPDEFIKYAQTAPNPASLPAEQIAANREKWIEAWTQVVLR
ncbi:MAG: thiamine ABC transporter substrate-binding protein [Anaerolineae bacterium]|nr:MAG: thiamine ABC transporter substrate-binding protein [Anaerolineae bacterium]